MHEQKEFSGRRFIPAYAGNSDETGAIAPVETVHPRLRGELFFVDEVLPGDTGSSPLTRGTLALRIQGLPTMRFIPAYAGNSQRSNRWNHQSPVHPRLRGELQAIFRLGEISDGSSPLTRGTQGCSKTFDDGCRFIPAYAGNSLKMVTTLH